MYTEGQKQMDKQYFDLAIHQTHPRNSTINKALGKLLNKKRLSLIDAKVLNTVVKSSRT